jgi:hypothetical protein
VDDELYGIARASIGAQFGLTDAQAARLRGTSASELRADAKAMRVELGLDPVDERERDEGGRFKPHSINEAIRAAAGR